MNFKWLIVGLFAISCWNQSSSSTIPRCVLHPQDAARALSAAAIDTPHPMSKIPVHSQYFTSDLNGDQKPDTITIVSSIGDTVTFDTIHISITNFGSRTFYTDTTYPWTTVDDRFLDSNRNALPTNKLFMGKSKIQSVLLLFGDISAAGYRDNFSIINIEGSASKLVLNQNERHLFIEAPLSLKDLDGDGRLDFLYRQIFEYNGKPDTLGGKIGTYSPYFVYTVDSTCVLNRSLTILYNKEHYVFAGFKYDESIDVFYPNDGSQPRLWKQ